MTIEPISSIMTVQAQNTAAAKNATTKVTTEENASEYNPANVKPIDKMIRRQQSLRMLRARSRAIPLPIPKGSSNSM